jgi:hypothetical protein
MFYDVHFSLPPNAIRLNSLIGWRQKLILFPMVWVNDRKFSLLDGREFPDGALSCASPARRLVQHPSQQESFYEDSTSLQPTSSAAAPQFILQVRQPSWGTTLMLWNTCWGNRALEHTEAPAFSNDRDLVDPVRAL